MEVQWIDYHRCQKWMDWWKYISYKWIVSQRIAICSQLKSLINLNIHFASWIINKGSFRVNMRKYKYITYEIREKCVFISNILLLVQLVFRVVLYTSSYIVMFLQKTSLCWQPTSWLEIRYYLQRVHLSSNDCFLKR